MAPETLQNWSLRVVTTSATIKKNTSLQLRPKDSKATITATQMSPDNHKMLETGISFRTTRISTAGPSWPSRLISQMNLGSPWVTNFEPNLPHMQDVTYKDFKINYSVNCSSSYTMSLGKQNGNSSLLNSLSTKPYRSTHIYWSEWTETFY